MMILGFAGIGFMAYRRRGQPGFRFTPTLAGVPAPPSTFVTRVFKSEARQSEQFPIAASSYCNIPIFFNGFSPCPNY
jgi:hypothetical protein